MCGFGGFVALHRLSETPSDVLQAMAARIQHRGPDGVGVWLDEAGNVGLCHRRLAIVELSEAGHQPMQCESQRYVLVFNGEIYNHLELRSKLEGDGLKHIWNGHSDTETLLYSLSYWGVSKTLKLLVGMFAIAVWDRQEQVLTLARDRMGEKPLYWGWQNGVLIFGSELKALKAHPAFNAGIDRDALALLLRYNYIPAPHSIYSGVEKLLPGHYVQVALGDVRSDVKPIAYWHLNKVVEEGLSNQLPGSEVEVASILESQMVKSIGDQMLSDVPLGAFLSGGVDSSTVVALMQNQSAIPVKTFTIGFDAAGFNEAEHALAVSKHLGTDHTEIYVGANDALSVIPKLPHTYCEPFADSSQIPTYLVSQLARQHVTVALSGDAGDELFGGYNQYKFAPKMWGQLNRVPLSVRQFAAAASKSIPLPAKVKKLLNVLPAKGREDFYHRLQSHWYSPESVVIGAKEPVTLLTSSHSWPESVDFQSWMMAMDAQCYMVDDILVKVDRASMANSLETRVPFLDHRVIELAWRIPQAMKIREGKGKWILRQVLYRHVPQEMIERPKKGFSIPLGEWLRGPLREWAETLLSEERIIKDGYFNVSPIRETWKRHLSGADDYSTKLWSILMFQAWLEVQE